MLRRLGAAAARGAAAAGSAQGRSGACFASAAGGGVGSGAAGAGRGACAGRGAGCKGAAGGAQRPAAGRSAVGRRSPHPRPAPARRAPRRRPADAGAGGGSTPAGAASAAAAAATARAPPRIKSAEQLTAEELERALPGMFFTTGNLVWSTLVASGVAAAGLVSMVWLGTWIVNAADSMRVPAAAAPPAPEKPKSLARMIEERRVSWGGFGWDGAGVGRGYWHPDEERTTAALRQ
jgi:hypothetical protein